MTTNPNAPAPRIDGIPHDAWYAAALSDTVGRVPVASSVLGQRVVLYRLTDGSAVALADRCVHAPVALSEGRVEGDDIIAPYTGFRYGSDGACVSVPTQAHVPYGASVHAYPVHDDGTFVWVWPGEPRSAALRPAPVTSWLRDPAYATIGDAWETRASIALMHDNFADITHLPQVDTEIMPPVLAAGSAPPLQVQLTETTVSFSRAYPPAQIAAWQADMLELDPAIEMAQLEEGRFVSPGLWVDRWTITLPDGGSASFVFTHALTPTSATTTRHVWRVSRNFAIGAPGDGTTTTLMHRYYTRMRALLERMQALVDTDGPGGQPVHVAADAAGIQVRRIMARLAAEEQR